MFKKLRKKFGDGGNKDFTKEKAKKKILSSQGKEESYTRPEGEESPFHKALEPKKSQIEQLAEENNERIRKEQEEKKKKKGWFE